MDTDVDGTDSETDQDVIQDFTKNEMVQLVVKTGKSSKREKDVVIAHLRIVQNQPPPPPKCKYPAGAYKLVTVDRTTTYTHTHFFFFFYYLSSFLNAHCVCAHQYQFRVLQGGR